MAALFYSYLWRVEVLNARPVIVHTEIIKFEKREYWEPGTYTRLPFHPTNHPLKNFQLQVGYGIMSADIIRAEVRINYHIPCAKHMV